MAGTGDKLLTAAEIKEVTDTKVNISDVVNALNSTSINKPLSAAQGKVLNDAKVNKTDTIAIEHGGTNATSASNARTNLGVYSKSEVDTAIAQSTADAAKTMFLGDVSGSSSLDITLNKNTRYMIAIFGLSSTRMGLLLARTSGTTAYVHEVSMGTTVTFSTSELVLTINNATTQVIQVYGIVINPN